jgi:hypothetical protein
MISFSNLAQNMYAAYCTKANGTTFDGKPLPTWRELGDNRRACWIAAAQSAALELHNVH